MTVASDLDHCREAIRTGSRSFHAASKLLPARVRDPALALYAFCRLADDEVDEGHDKARAVLRLQERLDAVYADTPHDAPEDRAFARLVTDFDMPRALPEALLEGLAWDATERRYATLSDLRAYSARVASAVGAMMCVLMGVRDADALARACDLGVAMQLTNIARDVGEDARAGRLYLPTDWLEDADVDAEAFLADPQATPEIRRMTRRLLSEGQRLYIRSEAGVGKLPRGARLGIYAARYIYSGIGTALRKNAHDNITYRAHTKGLQKAILAAKAAVRTGGTFVLPQSPVLFAPPLEEVRFLVEAATDGAPRAQGRTAALLSVLADLQHGAATSGVAAE